jgi:hypothetical protein
MAHRRMIAVATILLAACSTSDPGEVVDPPVEVVALAPATLEQLGQAVEGQLRPVSAFTVIADRSQRSAALFNEMGEVLTHPRCVNCHPRTDTPLQGDERVAHAPPVVRGPDGHGAPGMQCSTCHGFRDEAFETSPGESVPANPKWALAPIEMAWEGKSVGEICRQLRDRARNGGMNLAELHHHNAEDELVGYGWNPGPGREKAPGTQKEFGDLTQAWIDTGAVCPSV